MTETETGAVTGAETVTVTVTVVRGRDRGRGRDRVEIVLVIPVQALTPKHHHTPKGPGCAPDVPYDKPDRPKGPF